MKPRPALSDEERALAEKLRAAAAQVARPGGDVRPERFSDFALGLDEPAPPVPPVKARRGR